MADTGSPSSPPDLAVSARVASLASRMGMPPEPTTGTSRSPSPASAGTECPGDDVDVMTLAQDDLPDDSFADSAFTPARPLPTVSQGADTPEALSQSRASTVASAAESSATPVGQTKLFFEDTGNTNWNPLSGFGAIRRRQRPQFLRRVGAGSAQGGTSGGTPGVFCAAALPPTNISYDPATGPALTVPPAGVLPIPEFRPLPNLVHDDDSGDDWRVGHPEPSEVPMPHCSKRCNVRHRLGALPQRGPPPNMVPQPVVDAFHHADKKRKKGRGVNPFGFRIPSSDRSTPSPQRPCRRPPPTLSPSRFLHGAFQHLVAAGKSTLRSRPPSPSTPSGPPTCRAEPLTSVERIHRLAPDVPLASLPGRVPDVSRDAFIPYKEGQLFAGGHDPLITPPLHLPPDVDPQELADIDWSLFEEKDLVPAPPVFRKASHVNAKYASHPLYRLWIRP